VEMPADVAAASDKDGRRVHGPTTDRPGVFRRVGVGGGEPELRRSGDGSGWKGWESRNCCEATTV